MKFVFRVSYQFNGESDFQLIGMFVSFSLALRSINNQYQTLSIHSLSDVSVIIENLSTFCIDEIR